MKYTQHKLTDAMLKRLSAICNGRQVGGMSCLALETRGLIHREVRCWHATHAGFAALAQARAEGW